MLSVFAYKHLKQLVQHVVSLFKMVTVVRKSMEEMTS